MLNQFLISVAIMSQLLGMSLPQVLQEDLYIVPTIVEDQEQTFEWRVLEHLRSEFDTPLKLDNEKGPDTDIRSGIIMDVNTQQILWQKNPDMVVPIASITKLMTALTWLEHQPSAGLDHVHTFAPEEDTPNGKELNLSHGEQLRAFDLLRSSIVGSDNDTALALAHSSDYSDAEYVEFMNKKAESLSMTNTTFVDQTGLSQHNVSTPLDVARLAREAFSKRSIQEPAQMTSHVQETVDTGKLTRVFTTNRLLYDDDLEVTAGKTGYIPEAGYCVVVQVRDPQSGREIIVVVLGVDTDQGRFDEAKKLSLWTFEHYAWN